MANANEPSPDKDTSEARRDDRMRRYETLGHAEKIRLALQILGDVCEHWDREELRHYPDELPSFDEYLCEIACKLCSIEWAGDEPTPVPDQPRSEWCDCPRAWDDPVYAPDGWCACGERKHHWHCAFCRGLVQVG